MEGLHRTGRMACATLQSFLNSFLPRASLQPRSVRTMTISRNAGKSGLALALILAVPMGCHSNKNASQDTAAPSQAANSGAATTGQPSASASAVNGAPATGNGSGSAMQPNG